MTKSKYEKKKEEEHNKLKKWVQALIPHFSGPEKWGVDQTAGGYGVALATDNGTRLFFYLSYASADRVLISGDFTKYVGHLPSVREKTDITVAWNRPPKAIARDIERRLLPAYYRVLAQARRNKAEYEKKKQEKEAAMQALSCSLPCDPYLRGDVVRAYNFYDLEARWQPYDKTFELRIRVSLEQTLKIIELLKSEKEGG